MSETIACKLRQASEVVKSGGIVAYPTENCFGLGCHPRDARAVKQILTLKHRPAAKGLVVIGSDIAQIKPYLAKLPDELFKKMQASWPGAITWLAPAADWVPRWLRGDSQSIAVRVPDHTLARELCRQCGHALVSTSANQAGRRPCRSTTQVKARFESGIDYILDAPCGRAQAPSTIIDIQSGQVIR